MSEIGRIADATVARIWRYPVKSMRGERIESAAVDPRGLVGDRTFAVTARDGKLGSGKNSQRFRRMDGLLDFQARYPQDPEPGTTLPAPTLLAPDGTSHTAGTSEADAAVRGHLGRDDVRIAAETTVDHFDDGPISLMSTATLDWLIAAVGTVPVDDRRYRANLILDLPGSAAFTEDTWAGRTIRFGDGPDAVLIEVRERLMRCVMTNAAQDDLPYSSAPLKALSGRDMRLGVWGVVLRPGRVRAADPVTLV